jgi:energy-coupling factor transporter ATP-binding protein EcfA2
MKQPTTDKKKKGRSTQELIGIKGFSTYGLATNRGDLIFYLVSPTNISVLSAANIEIKVRHLKAVLQAQPDMEIACLDSCECFDENKQYIKERLQEEDNPAVRAVLEKDLDFLDNVQIEMATARQFFFAIRIKIGNDEQTFNQANRVEKIISEQGFEVKRLKKADIKRLLGIYFGASMNGELMGDHDGQRDAALGSRTGQERYSNLITRAKALLKSKKELTKEEKEILETKSFLDIILPSTIKFSPDSYICGDKRCCVWVIREYPPSTEEQAILSQLADRNGVTLRMYNRIVDSMEQRKVIQNATRKNKLMTGGTDVQDTVTAESNLQDVVELIAAMRREKEPLLHTAVYMELRADSVDALKELQSEILMELTRSKIMVDKLTLRQKDGFLSVLPVGANMFGVQFERILPASSVANMYPFNYSGKTDPHGFYIGRDKYGTNILTDMDQRADDKTNPCVLILGNSGQGKSHLLKLLLTNIREGGKAVIILDCEAEYADLTVNMGGCYVDFMSGRYIVNPLEPKAWNDVSVSDAGADTDDATAPAAFRKVTRLSQHIAYLKDFFRAYKDFTDAQIDTIEIMLSKLYARWNITDSTDYSRMKPTDFPVMSDLYALVEEEFMAYDRARKYIYTEEMLQEICLGLNSMCVGSESKYFNGHTNIVDDRFLCFGVKGIMDTNKRLKDAMLFNILSYMSNQLLGEGNTAGAIDELYLYLSNLTAIEYIRNSMKRVRKKDSAIIIASQNVDDFLLEGIREYTKPLFSIPTHQFLFNAGNVEPKAYIDTLQLEPSEFELIKYPERGTCLYRCGNERYLLQVIAPDYKVEMFGKAGGR